MGTMGTMILSALAYPSIKCLLACRVLAVPIHPIFPPDLNCRLTLSVYFHILN